MPDEATSRAFAEAVAAYGERVEGLTPVSRDERVGIASRHDRDPYFTPPVVEACAATQQMILDDEVTPERLAPVLWCAASKRKRISDMAPGMLGLLADQFPLARQAIVWLSGGRNMHSRRSAIKALNAGAPPEMVHQLLSQGLTDRAADVRFDATMGVSSCEARTVLPALLRAAKQESDANLRDLMTTMYHVCNVGYYFVEREDDERYIELQLRTVDLGYVGLQYGPVPKRLYDRIGPEATARLAAKRPEPYPTGINPLPTEPSTPTAPWELPENQRPWIYSVLLSMEGPLLIDVLEERHMARRQES